MAMLRRRPGVKGGVNIHIKTMKLQLSPTHPMHKGLRRGHGGGVWWVWLIGYVGVHGFFLHLRSYLRRCERRCEQICEHQHNLSTRPTTHFPHVPCTTPYAWDVLGTAPASWVFTPPFTPKHGLSMAIHSSNACSRPPYGEAFELEDDRNSVGMLSTCLFLLS